MSGATSGQVVLGVAESRLSKLVAALLYGSASVPDFQVPALSSCPDFLPHVAFGHGVLL